MILFAGGPGWLLEEPGPWVWGRAEDPRKLRAGLWALSMGDTSPVLFSRQSKLSREAGLGKRYVIPHREYVKERMSLGGWHGVL
jgi:hypothetical protein